MKFRSFIAAGLAAALAVAPVSSAQAQRYHGGYYGGGYRGDYHHGHNPLLLPFVAVAALVTGAALIATAPVRARRAYDGL